MLPKLFRKLIDHYENVQIKHGMATIHFNLATVLKGLGENEEAIQQFTKAVELFYAELEGNPYSAPLIYTHSASHLLPWEISRRHLKHSSRHWF